jgi:hypothetical protein
MVRPDAELEMQMSKWMRIGVLVCAAALWPLAAAADEGRVEINQACADAGCFDGDPSGFPVTITRPGSYVLTSDLVISPVTITTSDGIEIRADDVTLDLNGFAVRCVTSVVPRGPCSGQTASADAIEIAAGRNVRIANGTVRDFPQHGVNAPVLASSYSLDGVRAVNNGVNGIDSSGRAQILRSFATDNRQYGIVLRSGSALVLDSFTDTNAIAGLRDIAADEAVGRSLFRDGTTAITAPDLVDCIHDGVAQLCP